jgi:hypothetical protein
MTMVDWCFAGAMAVIIVHAIYMTVDSYRTRSRNE